MVYLEKENEEKKGDIIQSQICIKTSNNTKTLDIKKKIKIL